MYWSDAFITGNTKHKNNCCKLFEPEVNASMINAANDPRYGMISLTNNTANVCCPTGSILNSNGQCTCN